MFAPSCQQSTNGGKPRTLIQEQQLVRVVSATLDERWVLAEINDLLEEALKNVDAAALADAVRLEWSGNSSSSV